MLQAVTISTNAWTNAGHAVNQIYDILYMMGRDDIAVGVGGEGGILDDGTIQPNVGGYLSIIEQVKYSYPVLHCTFLPLEQDIAFVLKKMTARLICKNYAVMLL